jgi:hypothetical protein
MAQPLQTEAADGGANIAQLCAAQKLLSADAIVCYSMARMALGLPFK